MERGEHVVHCARVCGDGVGCVARLGYDARCEPGLVRRGFHLAFPGNGERSRDRRIGGPVGFGKARPECREDAQARAGNRAKHLPPKFHRLLPWNTTGVLAPNCGTSAAQTGCGCFEPGATLLGDWNQGL